MPEQRKRPLLNRDQAPKSLREGEVQPEPQPEAPDKNELPPGSHYRPLPSGGRMIITDGFINR